MVYMPATDATLLPRAKEQSNATSLQEAARQASQQAIAAVNKRIGPAPQTSVGCRSSHACREAIVGHFSKEDEASLCADVQQALANDGVDVAGQPGCGRRSAQGEEAMVLNLISYLDRRGYLSYLVEAVRQVRPGVI